MKKEWKIRESDFDRKQIKAFAKEIGVSTSFARILHLRGIDTHAKYDEFINQSEKTTAPFSLPDLEAAAKRVKQAVENNEKILIYGDYDADGVTAVALVYLYLRSLCADVEYYIPSRLTEGYGISNAVIEEAAKNGVSLMITVDTGITAVDEIANANRLGIQTVITDHHECQTVLPEAVANVDIKRPDFDSTDMSEYAGVGVALKLAQGIDILYNGGDGSTILAKYADIAAIGTVADVMSLLRENRTIVRRGLEKINSGDCRPGITALIESAGKAKNSLTAKGIGYVLAPRINAAGRMDSADTALELLICDDKDECLKIAAQLCKLNSCRQSEENAIAEQAMEMLRNSEYKNDSILVLGSDGWHHGVIGIVCSRITEKFGKPVILMTYDENGVAKASCRSTGTFNIVKAIEHCSELVTKFGGHEMAAGLTLPVENVDEFRKKINCYAHDCESDMTGGEISVDMILSSHDLTLPFATELKMLEPCGRDNPEPVFAVISCKIMSIIPLSGGKHTKMILREDGICFECIAFSFNAAQFGLVTGDEISIVFTLEAKEYMGRRSVQLFMKDICFEGKYAEWYECGEKAYRSFRKGEKTEITLPTRDDLTREYTAIRNLCGYDGASVSYREISSLSGITSYAATRIISDILTEAGVCSVTNDNMSGGRFSIIRLESGVKAKIEETPTYKLIAEKII